MNFDADFRVRPESAWRWTPSLDGCLQRVNQRDFCSCSRYGTSIASSLGERSSEQGWDPSKKIGKFIYNGTWIRICFYEPHILGRYLSTFFNHEFHKKYHWLHWEYFALAKSMSVSVSVITCPSPRCALGVSPLGVWWHAQIMTAPVTTLNSPWMICKRRRKELLMNST